MISFEELLSALLIPGTDEDKRAWSAALRRDWVLYGQIHITNAPRGHGLTRLDPRGITYAPPTDPDEAWRHGVES